MRESQQHAAVTGGAGTPLAAEHFVLLNAARASAKAVVRARNVARGSAWTTGAFGGLTLLGVLFGDWQSLVLGASLIGLGVREGALAGRLARFDVRAPRLLALNQLALGVVLMVYCAVQVALAFYSNGLSAASQPVGDAKVDEILGGIGNLTRVITMVLYAGVGVMSVLGTGVMALYYIRRRSRLEAFLATTQPWVVEVMRAAA
ncbi:MAG: hypothetical protein AB7G11_09465 [Phycisphaerales bacterium]